MSLPSVLLVNPNQYHHPPVIPIGLEHLACALRRSGFTMRCLDLCFSPQPEHDLARAVDTFAPAVVCLTVRNIDSALSPDTEFFLPRIKAFIGHIRVLTSAPVIIGGAGVVADPAGVLAYLGADICVAGPGESTLPDLLSRADFASRKDAVIHGRRPEDFSVDRGVDFDYSPYLSGGGIAGFETHKGCSSSCAYCIEAGSAVAFRSPADIVGELRQLSSQGIDHLHLCDAEFNEDLDFCLAVLGAIRSARLPMRWALYMKPGNYNRKLFALLAESGAYLVTLSVDTFNKCPEYWTDIESMVHLARRSGIRTAVDLLTGFPGEDRKDVRDVLDLFRRIEPAEVIVNSAIRIYPKTKIGRLISEDRSLWPFLSADPVRGLIEPVFYRRVSSSELTEDIDGDPLFRIAGAEKRVNYQRTP